MLWARGRVCCRDSLAVEGSIGRARKPHVQAEDVPGWEGGRACEGRDTSRELPSRMTDLTNGSCSNWAGRKGVDAREDGIWGSDRR